MQIIHIEILVDPTVMHILWNHDGRSLHKHVCICFSCVGSVEGPGFTSGLEGKQMCVLSGHTHMHTDTHVLTHADLCRMMNSRRRGQVDSHKVMKWNDGPPGRVGKKKKASEKRGQIWVGQEIEAIASKLSSGPFEGREHQSIWPLPGAWRRLREGGVWEHPLTVCVCVCVWGGAGSGDSKQQTPSKETLEIFTTHARTYKHSQKKTPLAFPALEFNAASA